MGIITHFLVAALVSIAVMTLLNNDRECGQWQPPPGISLQNGPEALKPNNKLNDAKTAFHGQVIGAEAFAVMKNGTLFGGTIDGYIVKIDNPFSANGKVEQFVFTNGRTLGLSLDAAEENLILCDAGKQALLSVNLQTRIITVLATEANGRPINYPNDVKVLPSGDIIISDSSIFPPLRNRITALANSESQSHFLASNVVNENDRKSLTYFDTFSACRKEIAIGNPSGRLLRYFASNRTTAVLAEGLLFANGIALHYPSEDPNVKEDPDYVLVAETGKYRVLRYWLNGRIANRQSADIPDNLEVFVDALPGFVDNINFSLDRKYVWLAIHGLRTPLLDTVQKFPMSIGCFLKRLILSLPNWLQPKHKPYAMVIKASAANGRLDSSLHAGASINIGAVTSAVEVPIAAQKESVLLLGSLYNSFMTYYKLT